MKFEKSPAFFCRNLQCLKYFASHPPFRNYKRLKYTRNWCVPFSVIVYIFLIQIHNEIPIWCSHIVNIFKEFIRHLIKRWMKILWFSLMLVFHILVIKHDRKDKYRWVCDFRHTALNVILKPVLRFWDTEVAWMFKRHFLWVRLMLRTEACFFSANEDLISSTPPVNTCTWFYIYIYLCLNLNIMVLKIQNCPVYDLSEGPVANGLLKLSRKTFNIFLSISHVELYIIKFLPLIWIFVLNENFLKLPILKRYT